ncbi:class I SAM-dependent methyltransferase [Alkalisalibacterium limincola]|uniref:Class I SAM-dependent methyltransferase n=1 Tax=Alkalisalibacterium limincola TaxID=2699169 RepID=A0A5C8KQD5_9GAMM|nr:class I SAM-dependent methyltransferase [Alkalisalibacterium limincola]TXK62140.1 class I SAM-dependent methyltransferase [Alkalisalibacterium limincola]
MNPGSPTCPVCRDGRTRVFVDVDGKAYFRCAGCECTFLDPTGRLAREAEHAYYLTHRNQPGDHGYRRFLLKLLQPLLDRLPPAREGLDFGCGPGPALAAMLGEAGHHVTLYDPAFHPDASALARSYDFITCTEVLEHLHAPAATFEQLTRLLRPGGWLAVMTCFQTDDARFAQWHYRRDPTHVVFYRESTLRHVAARHGLDIEVPCKDVALMRKPA